MSPSSGSAPQNDSAPVIPFLRTASPAPKKEAPAANENNDLESTLKAMLTPQQQAMFNSFSGMLKQQAPSAAEEPKGGAANG